MLDVDRIRSLAQRPASAKGGISMENPQRERGMWSFLTWSFFLSQLAIGNAFAGGAAQAAKGSDGSPPGNADSAGAVAAKALGSPDFRTFAGDDPQSPVLPTAAAQTQAGPSASGHEASGIERVDLAADTGFAARPQAAQNGGASEGGAVQPDLPPDAGPGVELPPIVEVLPGIDVPPVIAEVLPPILDTIDGLVESLGPILDDLLVPVVETVEDLVDVLGPTVDNVVSSVETLVDNAVNAVEPLIEAIQAPIENVVENISEIIEPIVNGIAGPLMELADPIVDAVEPILTPIINVVDAGQPILDPILDVITPTLEPIVSVTAPLLNILPLGIGDGTEVVGSPGELHFAASGDVAGHELFQAGAYTEYGLAMQQTPLSTVGGAADVLGDIVVPIEALFGDDDGEDAGNGTPTFLGSLQHEAVLRGLGDGLM